MLTPKANFQKHTPQQSTPAPLSILIVEDSAPQALRLKLLLENNGCRVQWSDTGFGGLTAARHTRFDLIILDIELPDINGFEVCKRLKTNPLLVKIPVIMMTTLDEAQHIMNGLEAGAVDYIPKDVFAETVLLETIRQMRLART